MIKEAYVSFKIAKLIKDKGFDEHCDNYYDQSSDEPQQFTLDEMYYSYDEFIKAPTHQMAMRWLREIHNKHCDIGYDIDLKWYFQIIDLEQTVEYDYPETKYHHAENETGFNTYEDAVEAAIKYCLENLI